MNKKPDAVKAFNAIAMILNAREKSAKVRLKDVQIAEVDVRKAG